MLAPGRAAISGRATLLVAAIALGLPSAAQAIDLKGFFDKTTRSLEENVGKRIEKTIEDVFDDEQQEPEPAVTGEPLPGGSAAQAPTYTATATDVRETQQRLTDLGYDPGPVDGLMGGRTQRAIAAFQRDVGMASDGLIGPSLLRALRARTQGVQTAQPRSPGAAPAAGGGAALAAPLNAAQWRAAVGMPGSCGIACFDALAAVCAGARDPGYREETAAIARQQMNERDLVRLLKHYDARFADHQAFYAADRAKACARLDDKRFADSQLAVRYARQVGHSRFAESRIASMAAPTPEASPAGAPQPGAAGAAPAGQSAQGAPVPRTTEASYPDVVRLALLADPVAFAAQRETAGVAYRLAVMDEAVCKELSRRLAQMAGDVFAAQDFALESAELLDQALAGLGDAPRVIETTLAEQVHVRPYDFAAGGYPIQATPLMLGGRKSLTERTSAPPCNAGLPLHHALPKQSTSVSSIGLGALAVELEGAPGAAILLMTEENARAFEARNARRLIELVGHVRLEPPEEAFGPLRGRVLALEARDVKSGETLHRFPVASAVAQAPDPRAPDYQPGHADFVHLALMSDLEAYLANAEATGLAYLFATGDAEQCQRVYHVLSARDEFAMRDLAASAARELRDVAATLGERPRRLQVPIEATYRLAEYDFDRGGFPFADYNKRGPVLAPGLITLPADERPPSCAAMAQGMMLEQMAGIPGGNLTTFMALQAEHQGVPDVTLLPMPVEQARAFRAAGKGSVVLRADLAVEPRAQGRGPLAGRIVGLAAHDPETGDLLHRFELQSAGATTAAPTEAAAQDSPIRWSAELAGALLGPVVEPTLSDMAFTGAATSYFKQRSRSIDQGNPPPGVPLAIDDMRGREPEVIVALNRDRLRAGLREAAVATPVRVVIEEELFPYYYDGTDGITLSGFLGHEWFGSANRDDPLRSTMLSSRDLPLYQRPAFLWPWKVGPELDYRADLLARAHAWPALELDRILRLDRLAVDIEQAAARGLVGSYDPRRERVIVRWDLDVQGARMEGQNPVISARLAGLSFRWASDGAPLGSVDVASLPTVAGLRAPLEAAKAQEEAEEAERERRAAEAAQARLDAILRGRTGPLLFRRADTEEITQVLVKDKSAAQEYRSQVLTGGLDLPAKARLLPFGAMTVELLRTAPGAAAWVEAEVFASELFGLVGDLDLVAEPLTGEPQQAEQSAPAASSVAASSAAAAQSLTMADLAPGDAPMLVVHRRDQAPIQRVFADDGSRYASAMREVAMRAEFYRDFELALELPVTAEAITLDEAPQLLRRTPGAAVVLRREGLEQILPEVGDLDLVAVRFPPEEYEFGIPKDHAKGADAFAILGITPGIAEAEVIEQLNWTLEPEEIAPEPEAGVIRVAQGACDPARFTVPGEAGEIGAYCLTVALENAAVARISLRQVLEGDASEAALSAFAERYGRSQRFRELRHLERGGRRVVLGWGEALAAERAELGRVDAKSPPAVLEAVVWVVDGVTTVLLHLDGAKTMADVEAAEAPQIRF